MDLHEVGGGGDWIDLAQNRDRWRALLSYGNKPSGTLECGEFLD